MTLTSKSERMVFDHYNSAVLWFLTLTFACVAGYSQQSRLNKSVGSDELKWSL